MTTLIIIAIVLLIMEMVVCIFAHLRDKRKDEDYQELYSFFVAILDKLDEQYNKPDFSAAIERTKKSYKR